MRAEVMEEITEAESSRNRSWLGWGGWGGGGDGHRLMTVGARRGRHRTWTLR